jgi:hypothetical protein
LKLAGAAGNFLKRAVNGERGRHVVTPEHVLFIHFPCRNTTMNKIVAALIASLFAVGAFAQASAPAAPAAKAAPAAAVAPMTKEAAPMAKAAPAKKAKKARTAKKAKMEKPAA